MSVLPTATLAVRFTNCSMQANHLVYPTSLESLDPITDRLQEQSDESGVIVIDGPCIICYDGLYLAFDSPETARNFARKLLVDNTQQDGEASVADPMRQLNVKIARILLNKRGNGASLDGFTTSFVEIFGVDKGIRKARQWWLDLTIGLGQL
ncbi:MAG TPA: hypothetical protein VM581_02780 [Magnetospirillaceae bacterium]|nr:hypothetical protein [Magnetospirillaceae bacterium]